MSQSNSARIDKIALLLSLLPPNEFVFMKQIVLALSNKVVNAHLSDDEQLSKRTIKLEIVDWMRGEPMPMSNLIGMASILDLFGYYLLPIESVTKPCQCCGAERAVSMVYVHQDDMEKEYAYELCLSCYMAVELTPVYAPEVQ